MNDLKLEFSWYFRGKVRLLSTGIINAKYSIVLNGAVFKVGNSIHIRLVKNQYSLPDTFDIVSPLDFIKVKVGSIPDDHKIRYMNEIYLSLREEYHGV